jgi:hypothetical protein
MTEINTSEPKLLEFSNHGGQCGWLDFGDDGTELCFGGNLDESAKVFFEAVVKCNSQAIKALRAQITQAGMVPCK